MFDGAFDLQEHVDAVEELRLHTPVVLHQRQQQPQRLPRHRLVRDVVSLSQQASMIHVHAIRFKAWTGSQ